MKEQTNPYDELYRFVSEGKFFLHTLKTPVTSLGICLDVLRSNQHTLNEQTRDYLRLAIESHQRIIQLLNEAHLQSSSIFNPQALIETVTSLFSGRPQVTILSYTSFAQRKPQKLRGNPFVFQEMIVCLINNALEAYLPNQHKLVSLHFGQENNQFYLDVVDAATGFQVADTTAYQTTKPGSHFGLGLPFVRSAVQHFGGELSLESSTSGTQVKITLPVVAK